MDENPERIPVIVAESYDLIARRVARRIAEIIHDRREAGRMPVLGLATGSTPIGVYRELIRMHREEGLDWSQVRTFNLDEYYPMSPDSVHSYHRFMWENLFDHVNIDPRNVYIPRGDLPRDGVNAHCRDYERAIADAGGREHDLIAASQVFRAENVIEPIAPTRVN